MASKAARTPIEALVRLSVRTPPLAGITAHRCGAGLVGLSDALAASLRGGVCTRRPLALRAAPPAERLETAVAAVRASVTVHEPELICVADAPSGAQAAEARAWASALRKAHPWVRYVFGAEPLWPRADAVVIASPPPPAADGGEEGSSSGPAASASTAPLFVRVADGAALAQLAAASGAPPPLREWPTDAERAIDRAGTHASALVISKLDALAHLSVPRAAARARPAVSATGDDSLHYDALVVAGSEADRVVEALAALVPSLVAAIETSRAPSETSARDEDETAESGGGGGADDNSRPTKEAAEEDRGDSGADDGALERLIARKLSQDLDGEMLRSLDRHEFSFVSAHGVFFEMPPS